jgi:hypothetical protein
VLTRTEKLKANIRKILGCFLFVLLSTVLGLVLGLVFGLGFVYFMNEGAFVSWEPFLAPTRFERILQATSRTIWVQASDESIYEGDILCQEEVDCQRWQIVERVPVHLPSFPEWPIKKSPDCGFHEFSFVKPLAREPVECVRAYFGGFDSSTTVYYALLENGSISIWKNSSSNIEALMIPFFSAVGIGIAAGMIGLIYWLERRSGSTPRQIRAG